MRRKKIKVINQTAVKKVLEVVDAGLSHGLGDPQPGEMCVMAAINYALGYRHGDRPKCVGEAVRTIDICINDCSWSSPEARAKGMRREAVAKLGSNRINQLKFTQLLSIAFLKQVLLKQKKSGLRGGQAAKLRKLRGDSLVDGFLEMRVREPARYVQIAMRFAVEDKEVDYAVNTLTNFIYSTHSDLEGKARDEYLSKLSRIVEKVLVQMKSPGTKYLDLCNFKPMEIIHDVKAA